jgi:hypothetical protein
MSDRTNYCGDCHRLSRRIAELEAQLAARPVAVVPEPTGISFVGSKKNLAQRTHDVLQGIEWARRHLHSVPPERVLGEGEEKVRIGDTAMVRCKRFTLERDAERGYNVVAVWVDPREVFGILNEPADFDALRASKGGE